MTVSLFQVFSIGIGPSSSHTVGPMRAALQFISDIENNGRLDEVANIRIELFGSLAMTGEGHQTDIAVLLGLEGEKPEECDPSSVEPRVAFILRNCTINLLSSVGGGFIIDHEQIFSPVEVEEGSEVPFPFATCEELLAHCNRENKTIAQVMLENEKIWRSEEEIREGILNIWDVMEDSVERGCVTEGILPGGLEVKRRAPALLRRLKETEQNPSSVLDWVSLFALAVNEENAAGGRIVTAPTNGAAGIIPAVLHYYMQFCENPSQDGIIDFFLTAGAMGILYKEGASFSAAEMGCQGEVGVACSMAAGGLAGALDATNEQIENAAEIGMEHNLGLTCDPIAGLVQVPCIERNTMGAIQAINACRLAMHGDGEHRVSLDQVIKTMYQTGLDMKHHYKETSEGGLAIHVSVGIPEC